MGTFLVCCFREFVQQLECSAALNACSPDVVLCSWMPFGMDWTSAMRACRTVRVMPRSVVLGSMWHQQPLIDTPEEQRRCASTS